MSQNGPGVAVVVLVSLVAGFIGGAVASLVVPAFTVGVAAGMADGARETAQSTTSTDFEAYKATMADIRSVATAIETYSVDHNRYPDADSPAALAVRVEPRYITHMPFEDAWGNELQVRSAPTSYTIRSLGADGLRDAHQPRGTVSNLNEDIVYTDGQFVQWADGRLD